MCSKRERGVKDDAGFLLWVKRLELASTEMGKTVHGVGL